MTNALIQLPAMAGTSLLSGLGRLVGFVVKRFLAAPLRATGLIVLTIGIAAAANNALFAQSGAHPAPFFHDGGAAPTQPAQARPVEVTPAPRRDTATTQSVRQPVEQPAAQTAAPAPGQAESGSTGGLTGEITNADMANAQRKLQAMGLLEGDIDGYYGPETAEAIRAFEMRNGMTPTGAMQREVIDAILRADASDQRSIARTRANARASESVSSAPAPSAAGETGDQTTSNDTVSGSGQQALQALITNSTGESSANSNAAATQSAEPVADTAATEPEAEASASTDTPPQQTVAGAAPANADSATIERVQRGLASLGFLHGRIDGVAGETTARAIRNFEVYHNYDVTGRVTPGLVDLLKAAGADI